MVFDPLGSLKSVPLSADLLSVATSVLAGEAFATQPWGAADIAPLQQAAGPASVDELRRRVSELAEAIIETVTQTRASAPQSHYEQVPLLRCVAPAAAGKPATGYVRVSNDEASAMEVSLYVSNFIADSGYELSSIRVGVSPRRASVPAKGEVEFVVTIDVPGQTPPGMYSGLIQATGCKYVKAVLMLEVL
jgi:hypothetical protein